MNSVALWQQTDYDFDATSTTRLAKGPVDLPSLMGSFDENGIFKWGSDLYPFQRVKRDPSKDKEPVKKRVTRWRREVAREEGIELEPEPPEPELYRDPVLGWWVDWDNPVEMDWTKCDPWGGFNGPEPDADALSDPRLVRQFHFVQKTASIRRMSEKESRRLHIFFRKPTQEKIKIIEELARYLRPFVLTDAQKN